MGDEVLGQPGDRWDEADGVHMESAIDGHLTQTLLLMLGYREICAGNPHG